MTRLSALTLRSFGPTGRHIPMKKNLKSSLTGKALAAFQVAVAKVVADHQRRGRPLAVWRNGEAVKMPVETADTLRETPINDKAKD
jgi:hypothetical protein